ncbi:S-layer homology domain-containing protein [Cohnella sp. 56]|uniref:S-layer homology domain-containing protein n=1 Tax=Cohnella sp. 56 TaxID=3113722 RepID=UPI0030EA1B54
MNHRKKSAWRVLSMLLVLSLTAGLWASFGPGGGKARAADGNLLANADFETGALAPWEVSDATKLSVTNAVYHAGSYSLQIKGDGSFPYARQLPIAVDANTDYVLSFYVKADAASTSIEYRTATADAGNTAIKVATADNVKTDWTKYELAFNSGSATQIRVVVKATKLAWFDDFRLAKAGSGTVEIPAGANVIAPTDAHIKYFGRWDKSNAEQYTTSWGGTYFKVNFTGTTAKLVVQGAVNLYARVDGQETYYPGASGIVDLTPTPLADGEHTLMVATPYTSDALNFRGLILGSGATAKDPQVGAKTIEFAGGSILAGYLLPKQALSDFAWLAPEMLGYEHTQIAFTGINLVDQWSGGSYVASKVGLSKQFFKLKNADSAVTTDWDFSSQPDAVVINVGTNDSSFKVPGDTYQAAYEKFLADIRAKYPSAVLYAQRLFNGAYAQETLNAVNARIAAGDANVQYIDTTGWLTSSDFIDGTHPNEAAHQKLALRFAAILGHDAGIKADNVSVSGGTGTAGAAKAGDTLTGAFDFKSDYGTAAGTSRYRWLLADSESGTYAPLDGATGLQLVVTRAQSNSYVKFEVTPVDATGKFGDAVLSAPIHVEAAAAAPSVFANFITASGDKLMDGTKVFRFGSLNYPGGMRDSEFSQEDALRTISAMGGQVTRTYVPPVKRYDNANASYALVLGPDAGGVMQFNEAGFRKLDNLLALANQYGVRLIIPFVDQWQWEGGIESYVNFRYPGTISNDAANDEDAWKFYTDPLVISDFKQVIHYMMNRVNTITGVKYKEDKAIMAWETGNELGGYNQDKFPQSWTTEIAKYIKEQEQPQQLVMDGRFAIDPASLTDSNIDIVNNHFYTGNFIDKVNADAALAAGKKPYILGEFGLYTTAAPVDALYKAALQNGTDGIMLWSLRPHKDDGGFYWHDENPGNWASYHWPGFSSGDYYGETGIIRTVFKYAHYMKENDAAMSSAVPAIPKPDNAPKLFPISSVADIRWQGSVGAAGYEVQRSADGGANWETVAASFSDGGRAGTPSFHDEKAISGTAYQYRVRGVNESGASSWSNIQTTTAAHVVTDELSLLYNDNERRQVYAYDHSSNLLTSSPDGNELGLGYKAYVSTAASGYLTYASPVPLSQISLTQNGSGQIRWFVSATNGHFTEITPTGTGAVKTATNLPAGTRYVKFSIPGNNSVQIDKVQLTYEYDGTGYQAIPALVRNGFIVDREFEAKADSKSANLQLQDGRLVRADGAEASLVYRVDGDVNSYRFTTYANTDDALTFYVSADGDTFAKVNPAVSRTPDAGGWTKVIYSDFAVPASTRYVKAVYPASAGGASPAIAQAELGFGANMIPLTDKPPASVMEDGEYDYGVDANIAARYVRNPNGDDISIKLDAANKSRGGFGVRLDYKFTGQYYAGLTRALEGANLSQFDVLHAWVKPDGSGNKLAFQLKTGDGRFWEAPVVLTDTTARTIEIKLSDFVQPQWNIEAVGAGPINLAKVDEFAVVVSSGGGSAPTEGTVYLDDVKLANASKLDNFEGYGGYNALLQKAFGRNAGGGSFDVSLDATHKSEGGYGMRIDYNYAGPGYAGGSLNPEFLNLKGYDGFTFWFQPDGSNNSLAIQFTDAAGKYWETSVNFKGSEPRLMYVPFDSFRYPSWYGSDPAARPDPSVNITAFSLYVGSTPQSTATSGTLYIDDINGAKFKAAMEAGSVTIDNTETSVKSLPLTLRGTAQGAAYVELKAGKQTFYAPVGADGKWTYTTSKIANGTKEVTAALALFDGTAVKSAKRTFEVDVANNPFDDGDPKPQTNYMPNGGFEDVVDASAWPILPKGWTHKDASGAEVGDGTVKLETTDVRTGTYRLVHWSAAAFEVTSAQEVTGLKDGIYELRAWTKSKGGQQVAEMTATTAAGTQRVNLPTGTSTWSYVKLSDLEVRDGKLTAGFHSKDLGGDWIAVDDVELVMTQDLSQPEEVAVTGIALDRTALGLKAGETAQLTATVAPADAADKTVSWHSSDEGVATVSADGLVTAVAAGTATVTVTTSDGGFTAAAMVTVTAVPGGGEEAAAPAWPAGAALTASDVKQTGLRLSWPAATSESPLAGYAVYSGVTLLGETSVGATVYDVSGLAAGTAYTFTVKAKNEAGKWSEGLSVNVTTLSDTTTPPVDPGPGSNPGTVTPPAGNEGTTVTGGTIAVTAKPDAQGNVAVALSAVDVKKAVDGAKGGRLQIAIDTGAAAAIVGTATIKLPLQDIMSAAAAGGVGEIAVSANGATIVVRTDAGLLGANAQQLTLTIAKLDASALSADAKGVIGGRPAYELSLTVDGAKPVSFGTGGAVSVTLDYKPQAGEQAHKLVVYNIADDGTLQPVKRTKADASAGKITFAPQHFSRYAVGYADVSFADLSKAAWAQEAIEALAARQIAKGTGADKFEPARAVTRAEFLQLLLEALDLKDASAKASFNDVKADAWYYGAVATGAKLGIVKGRADGTFGASDTITREDMAVMLSRAFALVGTKQGAGSATGKAFADQGDIAGYALDAVNELSQAGLINGFTDGKFAPKGQATRAQAAQVIYKLLQQ